MKLIIRDHLRRWWWVWVVNVLVQSIVGWFSATNTPPPKEFFNAMFMVFVGPFLLQFDLQRGIARALVALPLTARQIARGWWLAAVGLPAITLGVFTFLSAGTSHLLHPDGIFNLEWLAMSSLVGLLFLGTSFLVLLGFSTGWSGSWWDKLRNTICGAFWGLTIGGCPLVSKHLFDTPTKTMWVLVVGTGLTLIGWFRAERMVLQRAAFRPGIQLGRRQPGQHQAQAGFGGLPFLWQNLLIQVGRFALIFVGYMLLIQVLMHGGAKLSPRQLFEASLPALSSFGYFFMYMFLVLPMIMQLRLLRTLPISANALTATLVLLPTAPILFIGLVWAAVSGGVPDGGNIFHISSSFLTSAAMLAIAVPVFVWQGLKSGSYLLVVVLMMVSILGPVFFNTMKIPPAITALVSLGLIALAFELTRRLLRSSSRAYRPPPTTMTGWGGWR